jgi:hypothetical protein
MGVIILPPSSGGGGPTGSDKTFTFGTPGLRKVQSAILDAVGGSNPTTWFIQDLATLTVPAGKTFIPIRLVVHAQHSTNVAIDHYIRLVQTYTLGTKAFNSNYVPGALLTEPISEVGIQVSADCNIPASGYYCQYSFKNQNGVTRTTTGDSNTNNATGLYFTNTSKPLIAELPIDMFGDFGCLGVTAFTPNSDAANPTPWTAGSLTIVGRKDLASTEVVDGEYASVDIVGVQVAAGSSLALELRCNNASNLNFQLKAFVQGYYI